MLQSPPSSFFTHTYMMCTLCTIHYVHIHNIHLFFYINEIILFYLIGLTSLNVFWKSSHISKYGSTLIFLMTELCIIYLTGFLLMEL